MSRRSGPIRRVALSGVAACVALVCAPAVGERADRYKPTHVEADRMQYDDLKQVNVFTGSVVLTKGTIVLRGDRLVISQDPEGYQHGTAVGKLASFRQKRDGVDEWIEGYGEEIQYDGRSETVRFLRKAKVRRLEGTRVIDEIDGAVIVYNSRTEQFEVDGSGSAAGQAASGDGRVRVTIQPRLGDPVAPPAPAPDSRGAPAGGAASGASPGGGPTLRPAPGLGSPRPPAPR
jgi:lipopolysaccharide export system protein LptA